MEIWNNKRLSDPGNDCFWIVKIEIVQEFLELRIYMDEVNHFISI